MAYMTGIERLAIERGRQEGRWEGEVHGRATLLAIQLVERFGPLPETIQTRLAQATNEQLERWGERWNERLLDAATLDAVFEDH